MSERWLFMTLTVASAACSGSQVQSHSQVVLRDTTEWEEGGVGGRAARLWLRGQLIDTVDLGFGVHALSDGSLLILPVRTSDATLGMSGPTSHTLLTNDGQRRELASALPYFNPCFSNAAVDGDNLLYWGLRRVPEQGWALYAARYAAGSGRIDTVMLVVQAFATDNCAYLPSPEHTSAGYRFGSYSLRSDDWTVRP